MSSLITTISKRGQTAVPAAVRRAIKSKKIQWTTLPNGMVQVFPVPDDPIAAFRGRGEGTGAVEGLLRDRQEDKEREERKFANFMKKRK